MYASESAGRRATCEIRTHLEMFFMSEWRGMCCLRNRFGMNASHESKHVLVGLRVQKSLCVRLISKVIGIKIACTVWVFERKDIAKPRLSEVYRSRSWLSLCGVVTCEIHGAFIYIKIREGLKVNIVSVRCTSLVRLCGAACGMDALLKMR